MTAGINKIRRSSAVRLLRVTLEVMLQVALEVMLGVIFSASRPFSDRFTPPGLAGCPLLSGSPNAQRPALNAQRPTLPTLQAKPQSSVGTRNPREEAFSAAPTQPEAESMGISITAPRPRSLPSPSSLLT